MRTTETKNYRALMAFLVEARTNAGLRQGDLAALLALDQSTVSRYERRELILDIELLSTWCLAVNKTLEIALQASDYLNPSSKPGQAQPEATRTQSDNETAIPLCARETTAGFNLILQWRDREFAIPFPGVSLGTYISIEKNVTEVFKGLNDSTKKRGNRDAIADALQLAVSQMPSSNPSDIYHHIIYRLYLREYKKTDPKQSWVRAGGEALELFFKRHYTPLLAPFGLTIQLAFETGQRNKFLIEMGIADLVPGKSKLDICIYGTSGTSIIPFAGVHSKASLAERVSDDKPCSKQMMAAGIKSYLFTLDAKSFPPPHGDLINWGEFGSPDRPSDKRNYIEKHGSFDACFSYNLRSIASPSNTISGKKIYTSCFDGTDSFITVVSQDWLKWKAERNLP